MAKNLLIVESPAKAKTINKYLGADFQVMASYGHVRDLRPKEGAVEPDNDFAMHYEVIDQSQKHVAAIGRAMKEAQALYLATDPDREGEAISWHLVELLNERKILADKPVRRVVFHEITKRAIFDAMNRPRALSPDLIDAQQARRALDYLVGFNLSPLLWRKIQWGLSAGRVQSPALRMIVEREEAIEAFLSREYWTIEADLLASAQPFVARLTHYRGEKLEQFSITAEIDAGTAEKVLLDAAARNLAHKPTGEAKGGIANFEEHGANGVIGILIVTDVTKKQRRRNPAPPFTTSTLQQEAARKLGFTAARTMRLAQQLYEGIDTGDGPVGLITYMRTDSVALAQEALVEIRDYIGQRYGKDQLPPEARAYKTKTKNAQEAHEAIRPTSALRDPTSLRQNIDKDQYKLYELIWKRAITCQMKHATIDTVAVDLSCGDQNTFRATGSTVADPGFMAVYREGVDDKPGGTGEPSGEEERRLPPLAVGDPVDLQAIRPEQHFTEPPPRYTEASLIKSLEEYGIGRPSTYASIISTLQQREYAELDKKRFQPTDVGRIVNRFLTEYFNTYVDYDFTAKMEDQLDAIARGEKEWVSLMHTFWGEFKPQVEQIETQVTRKDVGKSRELGPDPVSGRMIHAGVGRYGAYARLDAEDPEGKARFASLRPGQSINTITLEEALALFKLPRELGQTEESEAVSVNIGRFGPYVRYGNKFASLGKEDDPYTIELERALVLITEAKAREAAKHIKDFPDSDLRILNGRYGPYITDGEKNARIPKDREPAEITEAEARELLANAKAPKSAKATKKKVTKKQATSSSARSKK
uniref:DNA topoisomerase 1 n=1 Tax=Candidatus Kentrum eta TaxID=2126337 RepID=A0A450U810_9GAMM|nr:MAG: DNA topoisomerase I [Candidatus Kentron sp. H]VFJ90026.1 MAG: DNA topoisomerase I [Candidatus Kentron sp. H]VFJ96402.1 MAG: DNA topoisomerase I [Candidatus Kentron sp. H]